MQVFKINKTRRKKLPKTQSYTQKNLITKNNITYIYLNNKLTSTLSFGYKKENSLSIGEL